jgi:hypothetical protein
MVVALMILLPSCSEKARPSIAPSVSAAATLAPGAGHFQIRLAFELPDGYARRPSADSYSVTWSSEAQRMPSVSLHLYPAVPYEGKNQCTSFAEDKATGYEATADRIARQCGGLVARYLRVEVSQELTDGDWWIGCEVEFAKERPTPSDIRSIDQLCGSVRWQVEGLSATKASMP